MAEEDLIFGKNRHFFGGIEPSNMQNFTAAIEGEHVKITAQLPADTVINGQTLCTVEGAVIRRNTTDYPKDEFDGEEVAIIKTSTTFCGQRNVSNRHLLLCGVSVYHTGRLQPK